MAIAHAHDRTQATSARRRFEAKIKDHAAKVQQRNVRSFEAAPPGPVSARAKAIGARTMARKTIAKYLTHRRTAALVQQEHFNGDDNSDAYAVGCVSEAITMTKNDLVPRCRLARRLTVGSGECPVIWREDYNNRAEFDAIVEVDHVLVGHTDATR